MGRELEKFQLVEQSINKKFHKTLWRPFINAMKQYEHVQAGDRIAACISGGKDSADVLGAFLPGRPDPGTDRRGGEDGQRAKPPSGLPAHVRLPDP